MTMAMNLDIIIGFQEETQARSAQLKPAFLAQPFSLAVSHRGVAEIFSEKDWIKRLFSIKVYP